MSSCPEGYVLSPDDNTCYQMTVNRHSFKDAQKSCWSIGAQLVQINSKAKQDLVSKYLSNLIGWDVDYWYIGEY